MQVKNEEGKMKNEESAKEEAAGEKVAGTAGLHC
jgi:hypothetical protein